MEPMTRDELIGENTALKAEVKHLKSVRDDHFRNARRLAHLLTQANDRLRSHASSLGE